MARTIVTADAGKVATAECPSQVEPGRLLSFRRSQAQPRRRAARWRTHDRIPMPGAAPALLPRGRSLLLVATGRKRPRARHHPSDGCARRDRTPSFGESRSSDRAQASIASSTGRHAWPQAVSSYTTTRRFGSSTRRRTIEACSSRISFCDSIGALIGNTRRRRSANRCGPLPKASMMRRTHRLSRRSLAEGRAASTLDIRAAQTRPWHERLPSGSVPRIAAIFQTGARRGRRCDLSAISCALRTPPRPEGGSCRGRDQRPRTPRRRGRMLDQRLTESGAPRRPFTSPPVPLASAGRAVRVVLGPFGRASARRFVTINRAKAPTGETLVASPVKPQAIEPLRTGKARLGDPIAYYPRLVAPRAPAGPRRVGPAGESHA